MLGSKSKNLEALATLQDNWDGYKGKKPTDAALKTASEIYFVPESGGGVQLEMHSGGMDIEILIKPDGTIDGVYASAAAAKPKWETDPTSGPPVPAEPPKHRPQG